MRYLLAISGGLDSMTLWELFRELPHCVAHFNHRQRGADSDADEAFVRRVAAERGVPFFRGEYGGTLSSEQALREERRRFLERARLESGCDVIATAHHLDDQLETLVLRLLRGTGLRGLGAMRERDGVWWKPLLHRSRAELEALAEQRGVPYREDASNATDRYLRNRVRRGVLPALRELTDGGFAARLAETLAEIRETADWVDARAREILAGEAVQTPYWTRFPAEPFGELPSFLASRVVTTLAVGLGAGALTRPQRELALRGAARDRGRFELGGGLTLEVSCGQLFFRGPRSAPLPDTIRREGTRLECAGLDWRAEVREGFLEGREVRFARPGDRLGSKKLKAIFLARRIPRPERALVPVVAERGSSRIHWIFPDPSPFLTTVRQSFPFSV